MKRIQHALTQITDNPLGSLILVLIPVFICISLVIVFSGANPSTVILSIIQGSLGSWAKISQVIRSWIPLMFCSIGLLYTFRINTWNIGIEGQMIMGAVCGMATIRFFHLSESNIHFISALLISIIGGSLWALLASFLKTHGKVHEIFSGLGLNFAAQGIILWLIFGPWKREGIASMSGTDVIPSGFHLFTPDQFSVSPFAVFLLFLVIVATIIILHFSMFGLKVKAIGSNQKASVLFGLNPVLFISASFILCGGLAGLAGFYQITAVYHRLIPPISSGYGYLGLLVVLLSKNRLTHIPFIAFFFSCLNVGCIQLPMSLQLDSSLGGVIQGVCVLSSLAVIGLKTKKHPIKET